MRLNPKTSQKIMRIVLGIATGLTIFILLFIIVFMLSKGIPVLNWEFLSNFPARDSPGGKGGD